MKKTDEERMKLRRTSFFSPFLCFFLCLAKVFFITSRPPSSLEILERAESVEQKFSEQGRAFASLSDNCLVAICQVLIRSYRTSGHLVLG